MSYSYRFEHADMSVEIVQDGDCESPRDYDGNVGVLVLSHRRYNLPCEDDDAKRVLDDLADRHGFAFAFRAFARYARLFYGSTVVLPVYGYDHGGLRLAAGERTYPFTDRGDSGIAGVVFDTAATRDASGVRIEDVEQAVKAEVLLYDQWANGDCWGFIVTDDDATDDGNEDSCFGFIGESTAVDEAKRVAEYLSHRAGRQVPSSVGWA